MLPCFGIMCFKHVMWLWPISMLNRNQDWLVGTKQASPISYFFLHAQNYCIIIYPFNILTIFHSQSATRFCLYHAGHFKLHHQAHNVKGYVERLNREKLENHSKHTNDTESLNARETSKKMCPTFQSTMCLLIA